MYDMILKEREYNPNEAKNRSAFMGRRKTVMKNGDLKR